MTAAAGGSSKDALIIVMGTSGSGKSTLGAALAEALHVPFVDGDDLHPAANVDKMSRGQPLDDADRLPWLLAIREEATRICRDGSTAQQQQQQGSEPVRELAEVFETSNQRGSAGEEVMREASRVKKEGAKELRDDARHSVTPSPRRACVIACSALKRNYRHLLRYGLHGADASGRLKEDEEAHIASKSPLEVYHVYVTVSAEELLRRMHERKGHFMKESMLQSQLATLEEPNAQLEPRTLVLADDSVDALVKQAKVYFDGVL